MTVLGWLLLALPCVPPALAWAALSRRLRAYEEREELRRMAKERRAMVEGMERAWRAMCRSGITVDRAAVERMTSSGRRASSSSTRRPAGPAVAAVPGDMERSDLGDLRKIVREAERLGRESWAFSLSPYGDEFDEDGYLTVSWFWDGDDVGAATFAVRLEREPEPRVLIRLEKEDGDPWLELPCNPLCIASAMRLAAG